MICYILYSSSIDKYYIGITTETIDDRLSKHNSGFYGLHFSSQTNDWQIFYTISCQCSSQMHQIEKHIKKMKSRVYLQNLRQYEEITLKLLDKFSCN